MTDRVFEGLGTVGDSLRRIARPIGRGLYTVRRMIGRFLGGVRGFIGGLLPILAIAAVAGGAYLLFFRAEPVTVDYRYANAIGGEGAAVSCIYSNKKPKVNIVRPPRGSGGSRRTSIAFTGPAGMTFAEACDGAEPKMEVRSLSMVVPGVIPVHSERVEREQKAKKGKGEQQGKSKKQRKRAAARDGEATTVFGIELPDFLPL